MESSSRWRRGAPTPTRTPTACGSSETAPETQLEIASGMLLGGRTWAPLPGRGDPDGAALAGLEAAILPALLRSPCLVAFSGGVDSALVLAAATRVARRHGLVDPLPFSWRFPWVPATDECEVQHRVVTSLRLREWMIATADEGELDFVGPVARDVLRTHGSRHPANLHFLAAPAELARGGSLLTGAGGDQILSGWRRPEHNGVARRVKDRVPSALRVQVRRLPARELPWLRPDAAVEVLRGRVEEEAQEPVTLGDRVRWHAGRRDLQVSLSNLRALGSPHDVDVVNPLADPLFVHGLAHEFGFLRAPRRSALVSALGRGLLPPVVSRPRPKARFGDVFLAGESRDLVRRWDGEGVDPSVVDVAALRHLWSSWPVPLGTAGLLQQAFLGGDVPAAALSAAA